MDNNTKNSYLNPVWLALLQHNRLDDFDRLWNVEHEWFEEPNRRRGGWSGVCRLELAAEDGRILPVFLKRQENHCTRTFNHAVKGMATARLELQNLLIFQKNSLPVPEIIYGADRIHQGRVQGMLLTRELTGYQSLDALLLEWQALELPEALMGQLLVPPLVEMIRKMHQLGFHHNCLYGKHIFARLNCPLAELSQASMAGNDDLAFRLCFLDLEKARRSRWIQRNIIRDLSQLERHTTFSTAMWGRFLDRYLEYLPQAGKIRAAIDKRSRHRH